MDGATRLKHPRATHISAAKSPKTPFNQACAHHTYIHRHTHSAQSRVRCSAEETDADISAISLVALYIFRHNAKLKIQNCHGNKWNRSWLRMHNNKSTTVTINQHTDDTRSSAQQGLEHCWTQGGGRRSPPLVPPCSKKTQQKCSLGWQIKQDKVSLCDVPLNGN